ncbi:MAG: amidase, partial [Woeseiaceae bacterium]
MTESIFKNHDALALADLVRKKAVSPQELLDEAIERVEKADDSVHLIANKTYEFARKQIEKGLPDGPFKG